MYTDLGNKQSQILEFIKEQISIKNYPPAVREICEGVGLKSSSTVHSHLNTLEKKGYIRRDPTKPRAIEVLDSNKLEIQNLGFNQEIINLPVVGQVTAGIPILAKENIEEYIPLPSSLIKGEDNFILKIKGDSMIKAGLLDGDNVIVNKKSFASNGQIVVALIHNEYATVKRFFIESDYIRLQPENDFMDPIKLNPKDVQIVGVVTGTFRTI